MGSSTIFVSRIPIEANVENFFSEWGPLSRCSIARDPVTGTCRGYAFISFKHRDSLDNCLRARPLMMEGRSVDCRLLEETKTNEARLIQSKTVFISGRIHSKELLWGHCAQFGVVVDVELFSSENKEKDRFGFPIVPFNEHAAVEKQSGDEQKNRLGFGIVSFSDHAAVELCVAHRIQACILKKALGKEQVKRWEQSERERSAREEAISAEDRLRGVFDPFTSRYFQQP